MCAAPRRQGLSGNDVQDMSSAEIMKHTGIVNAYKVRRGTRLDACVFMPLPVPTPRRTCWSSS